MRVLLLLILTTTFFSLNAQNCGTADHTPAERAYFLNTIKNYIVFKNSSTTCIPIKPYVFREDDGTGGVSLESLTKGIANLNNKYLEAGIEFYYSSAPVYVNNSDLNNFNAQSPDNDTEAMLITASGEVTNAVNIYFVQSIVTSSGFNAAGYAYFPSPFTSSNRILMRHSATSGSANGTFTHEFGHYFALPHTFSGTSNGNTHPNAENVPRTGVNANCSTNGDSFCDTDADPQYTGADFSSATCTHSGTDTDINGVLYNPLTAITNIMSYYSDACVEGFTAEQYTAITQGFIARQSFTNYDFTAPPMSVLAPTGLTAIVSGGVNLTWTDNASNEMGYIIERSLISPTSGFQAIIEGGTGENITTFSDLSASTPNTTYYYRVKASNGGCNAYSNVDSVTITYCLAGASICDEILTSVTVGSIASSSTALDCATSSYQDFTSLSTTMNTGTAYPISMTVAPYYPGDSISVWIDWNQDFDFDDAGEAIFTNAVSFGSMNSNITPPLSALAGNTRMRVRLFYLNGFDACGAAQYGEVEDYTININSANNPTCNISSITSGTQTACNSLTNNYTQEVIVSYSTPPATGTLDVNGQSFAIGTSPQTVILTNLTADGNAVNVTAVFSLDGTCTNTVNSLFTAPIDCTPTPICDISGLTAGTQSTCDPATNTYSQDVTVTYTNAPSSGTLDVNGQNFTIGTSPQTVTLTNLTADGNVVNVTAVFSSDAACNLSLNNLFTAPVNCSLSNVVISGPTVYSGGSYDIALNTFYMCLGETIIFSYTATSSSGDNINIDALTTNLVTIFPSSAIFANPSNSDSIEIFISISPSSVTPPLNGIYPNATLGVFTLSDSSTTNFNLVTPQPVLTTSDQNLCANSIQNIDLMASSNSAGLNFTTTSWTQTYGTPAFIVSPNSATTTVNIPLITQNDSLIFECQVATVPDPVTGIQCVSTENITIYANLSSSTGIDSRTECDSLLWIDGITYTSSNNAATFTTTNVAGCDSIITLDLTINSANSSTETLVACDSLTWIDGITYTASNTVATFTTTNVTGCDSIITLDLTINTASTSTENLVACDSLIWIDGVTYTASNNVATFTTTNVAGCDSVVTLNLTINSENTSIETLVACNPLTWIDGITYTSSNNIATFTTTNVAGCDSVIMLDLTINSANASIETLVACDSLTWIDGITYTSSNNIATFTTTNIAACDSVITLDLTINSANTSIETLVACDSLTWIDGNTYTSSNNVATFTTTNVAGCDSIISLDLTINLANSSTETIVVCDSLTWIDGNTYTSSNNIATFTTTNIVGCDSVIALDLTVNSGTTSIETLVACDSLTWIDGVTYTSSNNIATFITTNVAGCDSVVTLDLTINYTNTSIETLVACDSLTWLDGITYTASNNIATFTTTNFAGCDSVITLDLTINYATTSTETIVACDSLTWIDGVTYTVSNSTATYNLVGSSASGCDSLVTLDLIINNITNITAGTQTACDPATNTYMQEIIVTYSDAPSSGTLDVNGQSFAIGTSPQLVILNNLIADGATVNVVANFSTNSACTLTSNALFMAPADCTPPCNISNVTVGVQTACSPATNTYNQEIIVSFISAPTTGTLDVNGQSFAIGTSPQSIILNGLTADGAAVNVAASFSADATCALSSNALFTAPIDCTPPCNISNVTAGIQVDCLPATNTYSQEIIVTFTNAPTTGTLDINGQNFAIGASPQTITLTGLTADGSPVDVIVSFSDETGCTNTVSNLFIAPENCTPPRDLVVIMYPNGAGTLNVGNDIITTTPFAGSYLPGTIINLLATPNGNNVFSNWRLNNVSLLDNNSSTFFLFSNQDTLFVSFNGETAIGEIPETFEAFQIYPTIIGEKINVNFKMNETTNLSLDLFSLDGKLIQNLYRNKINAGIDYKETFYVDISSGIYFIKINTDKNMFSKKIIKF